VAYADTLAKMVRDSGLTLQQISIKCKVYGIDISHSYISKLQNDKQAPPSDKVSEAIAKACGANPEILLYEGYLAKVPDFVRDLLTGLANLARQVTKQLTLPQLPAPMAAMFEQHLDQIPDVELVKEFIDNDVLSQINQTTILKDYEGADNKVIAAPFAPLPMPDNSMEPLIPVRSRLELTEAKELQNGDIVVATTDENSYVVRKYLNNGDSIILAPEAKGFEPIVFDASEPRIIAKVKAVVINL